MSFVQTSKGVFINISHIIKFVLRENTNGGKAEIIITLRDGDWINVSEDAYIMNVINVLSSRVEGKL